VKSSVNPLLAATMLHTCEYVAEVCVPLVAVMASVTGVVVVSVVGVPVTVHVVVLPAVVGEPSVIPAGSVKLLSVIVPVAPPTFVAAMLPV
jgi:hypothetical protein